MDLKHFCTKINLSSNSTFHRPSNCINIMWSFLGCIKYVIHANQYWATIESQNIEAEKGLSNKPLLGSREILGGVWLTQEVSQHPFLVLILSPPFSTWKSGQRGVLERAPNPVPHCQQSWSGNPKLSIYALNHHTPLPYLSSHFILDGKIREEQFLHATLGSFTGTWPPSALCHPRRMEAAGSITVGAYGAGLGAPVPATWLFLSHCYSLCAE